jgi:hypothetical protein
MSSGPFALLLKQTQEEGRRFLDFLFLLRDVSALYQTGFRLVIFFHRAAARFPRAGVRGGLNFMKKELDIPTVSGFILPVGTGSDIKIRGGMSCSPLESSPG